MITDLRDRVNYLPFDVKKCHAPKAEDFANYFLNLTEGEIKKKASSLRERVIEIGDGKLESSFQTDIYRMLTHLCVDEVYKLKSGPVSVSLSKPLIKNLSGTIFLAVSSGIISAKNQYVFAKKYGQDTFNALKEFLSDGNLLRVNSDNVLEVFECAKELQISNLEYYCRTFLLGQLKNLLNKKNILDYVYWAEYNNEPIILERCIAFIRKIPQEEYADITPHFRWQELTPAILKLVWCGDVNLVESSIYVYTKISDFKKIIVALNVEKITFEDNDDNYQDFADHIEAVLLSTKVTHLKFFLKKFETLTAITNILKKNETIKTVDLSHSEMGDKGAAIVADMLLENNSLLKLDLTFCQIGVKGAKELAKALKINRSLRKLSLNTNQICCVAVKYITTSLLHNSTLLELELGSNKIGKEGIVAVAEMLNNNKTLKSLHLYNNELSSEMVIPLAASLINNSSLQKLHLAINQIDIEAALCFEYILNNNNNTLMLIDLHLNKITKKSSEDLTNNRLILGNV